MASLNIIGNVIASNSVGLLSTPTLTLTTNPDTSTAQEINFLKTGEQSLSVDWGDGTITTGLNHSHIYASSGVKNAVITCDNLASITSLISSSGHWNYNISDAPSGLTFFQVYGSNTLSGNISDAPSGLTGLIVGGFNTLSGNIADAPSGLTDLRLYGSNTLSGNISDAPSGLTGLIVGGSNTLIGNIADAPSGLTFLRLQGYNTLSGNISDAPSGLTSFEMQGSNTIQYNSLFNNIFTKFVLLPSVAGAWSSTQIDNFLNDLEASIAVNSRTGTADVSGNNAARTAASDADVTAIQSAGWTLTVNV